MKESDTESVRLDEAAQKMAIQLASGNPSWSGLPLRLYIEGKGCDGFYYGVTFDDAEETDLRFSQPQPAPDIIIDPDTWPFVKGSSITWVDDDRGRGFLVENPGHRQYRGKFFKRKVWREKLAQKSSPENA